MRITATPDTRAASVAQGPLVLRPRQVRALLQAPDCRRRRGRRDAALLAVLAGGGLRVGECCRLTLDQVERGPGGRLRLMVRTAKQKSGDRWRTVTLPGPAARLLREYIDHTQPRFFIFEGRRHEALCIRQAQKIATRYLRQIGAGHLHTHSLRHTFGSIVTRETRSIFVAQKLLGHQDPRTTSRYYAHFEVSDGDEAADLVAAALARRARRTA